LILFSILRIKIFVPDIEAIKNVGGGRPVFEVIFSMEE